jgi:hypothetical protein
MNKWTYLIIVTLGLGFAACNAKSDNPEGKKNPQHASPQEKVEENSNNLSI